MNVTDPQRARAASGLIVAGLAANVGLTVLYWFIRWVVTPSYDSAWTILQELLWFGATGVLVLGLFQLGDAVSDGSMLKVAAGVNVFSALIDLALALLNRKFGAHEYVYDASMLISLVARGLLILVIVQLTMKTHAWVLPLLGMVGVLTVMRIALSMAISHGVVDRELYRSSIYMFAMPVMSAFNVISMLVGGLALKSAVPTGPGIGTPALVAAAGLRPAEPEPISPASDFLVGGILLVVGIGVTVVSMEAASNGGRYIVATGAIGVGLARIIRGFVRAARGA